MHKKLIAVAVAGALAGPAVALAQVQIGGSLNLMYYQHDPKNKNVASKTDILEQSEPELYVRAEEKLGGGLSVWMQCATSIDGIGSGNAATVAGLCTRNSALGVKGDFGNVFGGNWDTPSKLVQNRIRGWFSGTNALQGGGATLLWGGSSSGVVNPVQTITASPVIGGTTGAATANGGAQAYSFYRRQAQSWNYHSPSWGGFQLMAAYSAGNESTGIPDTASPKLDPRLLGLSGQYSMGPLWIGLGWEQHKDYNPGNTTVGSGASQYGSNSDDNITLGVGYTFAGRFKLTAGYSQSKYKPTNTTELKVKGWALYSENNIAGPHGVNVAYIMAKDTEGNSVQGVGAYKGPAGLSCGATGNVSCASNTGGKVFTVAYTYNFSKRTQGFVSYDQMKNDSNATFNMGKVAATFGGKQSSIGVGLKHSF